MRVSTGAGLATRIEWTMAISVAIPVVIVVLASPTFLGGPSEPGPDVAPFLAFGAGLYLVGITWMWRIQRALRQAPPPWRYRDR